MVRTPKLNRNIYKAYRYSIDMEKIPKLKKWEGCNHPLTRKLYFQRGGKWVTTEFSICDYCKSLIKKERIENE